MAGDLEIVQEGPSSYVVRMDGQDQSFVDLADPRRLVFDYVRRMGDVIDAHGEPGEALRVVHVGGAGMTLPRYVAATRPRSGQIVLEPDEAVTDLVRERLPLPRRSGIKVRPVAGRAGLDAVRADSTDVVVVDAFVEARVPDDLVTVQAFESVRRILAPDGIVLLNLTDRAPFAQARRVVAGLRTAFDHVLVSAEPSTLRARRTGNLLLVASTTSVPTTELRARAATSPLPYRVLDVAQVSSSFGGGAPLTDD